MVGLEAVAGYLPRRRIDNLDAERLARFGVGADFIRDKTGMCALRVAEPGEQASDMCIAAFRALEQRRPVDAASIECLVVCTQNPDGHGLPHTSAAVHAALDLPKRCAAFDISLGCSGYVYGLSIVKSFMEANGLRQGLLFTADPYSKVIDPDDRDTALLFGDAASVSLLGPAPAWRIGEFVFGSAGAERDAIHVGEDGRLHMNGRAVFTFSATVVPQSIKAAVARNRLTLEEVDRVILHQGSRYVVDTIRARLGLDESHAPFVAAMHGNTVSSSIPLALEGLEDTARTVVISGFGVGLSWASAVLTRVG